MQTFIFVFANGIWPFDLVSGQRLVCYPLVQGKTESLIFPFLEIPQDTNVASQRIIQITTHNHSLKLKIE